MPLPRWGRGMCLSSPRTEVLQDLAPCMQPRRRRLPGFIGPVPPPLLIRAFRIVFSRLLPLLYCPIPAGAMGFRKNSGFCDRSSKRSPAVWSVDSLLSGAGRSIERCPAVCLLFVAAKRYRRAKILGSVRAQVPTFWSPWPPSSPRCQVSGHLPGGTA